MSWKNQLIELHQKRRSRSRNGSRNRNSSRKGVRRIRKIPIGLSFSGRTIRESEFPSEATDSKHPGTKSNYGRRPDTAIGSNNTHCPAYHFHDFPSVDFQPRKTSFGATDEYRSSIFTTATVPAPSRFSLINRSSG